MNCLLQGKFRAALNETARFIANSTVGLAGLFDVAESRLDLKKQEEDFGQTLGSYGFGAGFYIHWPILGPSSLRDTIGMGGDFFLDPWNYMDLTTKENIGIKGFDELNGISLTLEEIEDLRKAALDPYVALRDFYFKSRKKKIKE